MVGLGVANVFHCSADAVVKSTLLVVKRSALIALADTDHKIPHLLWTLTTQELRRLQAHMLLLIRSAQERVACFLLEMAERTAEADVIDLPMSRHDIADYLGLHDRNHFAHAYATRDRSRHLSAKLPANYYNQLESSETAACLTRADATPARVGA